jgi:hypothetical protein
MIKGYNATLTLSSVNSHTLPAASMPYSTDIDYERAIDELMKRVQKELDERTKEAE